MKILIIEDEPYAAARLQKYVSEIEPESEFVAKLESIEAAVTWFDNNAMPDLAFFDIHLSDGSCFEIFEHTNVDCPIIFATAYDEYALKAFQQHSIDYILKPIKKKDLERAFQKMRKLQKTPTDQHFDAQLTSADSPLGALRFLVKVGSKINLIKIEDVAYFYSKDKITFAITREGRRFPLNKSLEALESEISARDFFRINRKFIIHMESIDKMHSHTKGRVRVLLNPPIEIETIVSTERSPHFKQWLKGS
ncbi:MAG: response regulator transcription factor [Saprospiraceae bacterium]|nr:response regulator transcription factor [Saprospiraceae bacterium]